jgi:hypothetical protein
MGAGEAESNRTGMHGFKFHRPSVPILYPLVIMQSRTAASSSWARCPCDGVWKAEMDELLCLHAERSASKDELVKFLFEYV